VESIFVGFVLFNQLAAAFFERSKVKENAWKMTIYLINWMLLFPSNLCGFTRKRSPSTSCRIRRLNDRQCGVEQGPSNRIDAFVHNSIYLHFTGSIFDLLDPWRLKSSSSQSSLLIQQVLRICLELKLLRQELVLDVAGKFMLLRGNWAWLQWSRN
jgi:hypothetical protein